MKNLIFTTLLIPLLFIGCTGSSSDNAPWVSLFNGKDLTGWEQKGGVARYTIEDGAIVGTTVPASPNTFLCTKEKYGDFILEFDVKLDGPINSGVQFRSNNFKEYDHGRVHGYQCELDPSDRSWTGGIYDEARRGWLYPLNEDEKARAAYKHLEWNKIRIEAIGDSMKIWVNDIPTAHLIDDRTPSGYIALQVHSISVPEEDNKHIMWRNIRIITDNPANYATPTPLAPKNNYNRLTGSEASWEWKLLWDGQSTTGWRGAKSDTFPLSQTPGTGWEIKDGMLIINGSDGGESSNAGDIVTTEVYGDFELYVDFKISEGANSGIKYFVDTELNKKEGSAIGLEYQILDDATHPDAQLGAQEGSRTMGSLYDLIKAENKTVYPIGVWNHAGILSNGNHVEHWLNGRKILEYDRNTPEFQQLVDASKYNVWPGFGTLEKGHILLQDHGHTVYFRNLIIRSNN